MRRALLVAAMIPVATAAHAEKAPEFVKTKSVADKPVVQLDRTQAHILLRSPDQSALYLLKMPSAQDQAEYDRMRAEALTEARAKYVKRLVAYESARKARASQGATVRVPDKPVEPTEAGFEFTPFALMAGVPIGPLNRFAKGENGASTYLQSVTPGRYRVYGAIAVGTNGAMIGICYCMGSVGFEARAGEVVDVSALAELDVPPAPDGVVQAVAPRKPGTATPPLDPRLAGVKVAPAQFRPVGKMPNYFGLAISRLSAMSGVMRYDRDRIVDLTSDPVAGSVTAASGPGS